MPYAERHTCEWCKDKPTANRFCSPGCANEWQRYSKGFYQSSASAPEVPRHLKEMASQRLPHQA